MLCRNRIYYEQERVYLFMKDTSKSDSMEKKKSFPIIKDRVVVLLFCLTRLVSVQCVSASIYCAWSQRAPSP